MKQHAYGMSESLPSMPQLPRAFRDSHGFLTFMHLILEGLLNDTF